MKLSDVLRGGTRLWLKSEWGPADDSWPAVSFSKRSVGDYLREEFRPGRDAILYVGTSNPETTQNPEHRQRLLSAVSIEARQLLETRECVSAEAWEEAQRDYRGRWWWSMPALAIWEVGGFPLAYDIAPVTYSRLGLMNNRGNVVEVLGAEREAILNVTVHEVSFQRHHRTGAFASRRAVLELSREVRTDIGKMVARILAHVQASGSEQSSIRPTRTISEPDLHVMLGEKWIEQNGRCFLCNGLLFPDTNNYLLQSSCDRLDSSDTAYSRENTHITHLGCNLAKNKVSLHEFEDWITVLRGEVEENKRALIAAGRYELLEAKS